MHKMVIDRLNKVPEKNFIDFIDNMLGIKLLPASRSTVPVTFLLSDGAKEQVFIPEKTQLAVEDIIFETEKNILVAPAKMVDAYKVNASDDEIYKSPYHVFTGEQTIPFQSELMHSTNENDEKIFLKKTEGLKDNDTLIINRSGDFEYAIVSQIEENMVKLSGELKKIHKSGDKVEKILTFDLINGKNQQEHIIYLGHNNLFNLKKISQEGSFVLTVAIKNSTTVYNDELVEENIDKLKWEYWGKDCQTDEDKWRSLKIRETSINEKIIKIFLEENCILTEKKELNGIKNFWVRCVANRDNIFFNELENIKISTDGFNKPDLCFYNDIPLDTKNIINNPIYPFGKAPKINDFFYIASRDAFSKKGAVVNLKISGKMEMEGNPPPNPQISWDYWDGKGWAQINGITENLIFTEEESKSVVIEDFPEIRSYLVNGQENFWIRLRLSGGNFGQEVIMKKRPENDYITAEPGRITPPVITGLSIHYSYKDYQDLGSLLTFNNLEYNDKTEECIDEDKSFKAFIPLDEKYQTIYFGFDGKLKRGPISLFLSIEESDLYYNSFSLIKWEYFAGEDNWMDFDVSDETRGFTRSGTIELFVPDDFRKKEKFGKELYWIRAVNLNDSVRPVKELMKENKPIKDNQISLQVKKILLNSTWAGQSETIYDEIVGSSDGTSDQMFKLNKNPIISAEIWIDEGTAVPEYEIAAIQEDKKLIRDEKGDIKYFWVKWKSTDDILISSNERVFELDKYTGEVLFGNGIQGKVPPIGTDNIKANYRIGGGLKGNIPINQTLALKSSIPFIDRVFNPLAASGGSDAEIIDEAMERGPMILKNRDRAITADDFEYMALKSSKVVKRAKCLPNFDLNGKFNPGWVTLLVIPQSSQGKPHIDLGLKKQVEDFLSNHSATALNLHVSEPHYVEVSVNTSLTTISMDVITKVEKEANLSLKRLLDPVNGGHDSKGWEFGRLPYPSDFYLLLESIDGVDHVNCLSIDLQYEYNGKIKSKNIKPEKLIDFDLTPFTMIYSGNHRIIIENMVDDE